MKRIYPNSSREPVICRLPFPETIEQRIVRPTEKYDHENSPGSKYALDFLLNIGTPILAARGGTVFRTESSFGEGGLDEKFANEVNYVAVNHGDGTFAEYLHLGKDQVDVEEGQEVQTGDLLGYSGLSGCMSHPHLHFNVFKIDDGKAISIPVEFTTPVP